MAAVLDTTPRDVYFAGQPIEFEVSTSGTPTFTTDYRHFVAIYEDGGSVALATIPLVVDGNNDSKVNISAVIKNFLLDNNAPLIPVASNSSFTQGNIKDTTTRQEYVIKVGEILDGVEQTADVTSASFVVMLGGLPARHQNVDFFASGYTPHFIWLTTLGENGREDFTIYTSDFAPHFLAFTNQFLGSNASLKVTFYYNDGGQTAINTATKSISEAYHKFLFQGGARQINNGTTGASATQTLIYYEVEIWKNQSTVSSSKITFKIVHYWNQRTQYLVVGNSQGGFDTVTCEPVSRQLITSGDSATRLGTLDTDLGRSFGYNSQSQRAYTMQTRLLREFEVNQVEQLLHSPWWCGRYDFDDTNCPPSGGATGIVFGASFTPIAIQKGTIQIVPQKDRLFRVQFTYLEAYINEYV